MNTSPKKMLKIGLEKLFGLSLENEDLLDKIFNDKE